MISQASGGENEGQIVGKVAIIDPGIIDQGWQKVRLYIILRRVTIIDLLWGYKFGVIYVDFPSGTWDEESESCMLDDVGKDGAGRLSRPQ